MITAQELVRVSSLKSQQISALIKDNPEFTSVEFLGLTNAGQFCYKVVNELGEVSKVFITRNFDGTLGAILL